MQLFCAQTASAPRPILFNIMPKKSDNLIADSLFRILGNQHVGVSGTLQAGTDAVRQILHQKAGIDLGSSIIVDRAGLLRHHLISPITMMRTLQYII